MNYGASEDALCASHSAIKKKETDKGREKTCPNISDHKGRPYTGPDLDMRKSQSKESEN